MTIRVMLSLPRSFLAEVDEAAREEYRSRSELVREALRRYLESRKAQRGARGD